VRRWKRKKNDNEMQDFDTAIKQQKKGDKDDSSMMAIYNSHDNNTIDEDNGEEAKANQNADLVLKKKSSFSDSTDANNFKKVQNVQLQCHGKTIGTTKFEEKQKTQVFLQCIETTNTFAEHDTADETVETSKLMLSTVEITTSSNANSGRLCNSLCFLLRKMNYPVVNDRFCKREYASLPRYVRNVLKNKFCM